MTRDEARKHPDYKQAYEKIVNYPQGFTFTVNLAPIPKAKRNALHMLLTDAVLNGLLESRSIDIDLNGNVTAETFKRL